MKNIFHPSDLQELRSRVAALSQQSTRRWGRMNAQQAMGFVAARGIAEQGGFEFQHSAVDAAP